MFQGVEAKNILRTGIVNKLLSENKELHIVLFVKNREREKYYKKEFDNPRIDAGQKVLGKPAKQVRILLYALVCF